MEWLNNVYLGCFIFGLVFTIISFLLGGLGHLGNLHLGGDAGHVDLAHGGHVHAGHIPDAGHAHTDADTGHTHENGAAFP